MNQIIRSSSSLASNYRAACRGKSKADFKNELKELYKEADELLSIIVASINTANRNVEKEKRSKKIRNRQSEI